MTSGNNAQQDPLEWGHLHGQVLGLSPAKRKLKRRARWKVTQSRLVRYRGTPDNIPAYWKAVPQERIVVREILLRVELQRSVRLPRHPSV